MQHHIPADVLAAYAAGASTAGEDLFIACHLSLCPACRATVERAERLGEEILSAVPAVAPPEGALASLLAQLDAPAPPAPAPAPRCTVFPAPLTRRVGPFDRVAWRTVGGGLRAFKIPLEGEQQVLLLDFPERFRIPIHGHHGTERALVLRGGFTDERSSFARGDVSWREEGGHEVTIDPDGRCTSLFVNDGPAELGILTPLVDWWINR